MCGLEIALAGEDDQKIVRSAALPESCLELETEQI